MSRPQAITIATGLVALVVVAWLAARSTDAGRAAGERRWAPLPRTVTVEVWNGGGVAGAARDAALRLRRGGLDVVNWENAPPSMRDTLPGPIHILVRAGDTAGTGRVAEVLGPSEVIDAPDATRLVDLTVIVPRDST
jgi:hypothetical protein